MYFFPKTGVTSEFGSKLIQSCLSRTSLYEKMDIAKELRLELGSHEILAAGSGVGGFEDSFEDFVDAKEGDDSDDGYPKTALER